MDNHERSRATITGSRLAVYLVVVVLTATGGDTPVKLLLRYSESCRLAGHTGDNFWGCEKY